MFASQEAQISMRINWHNLWRICAPDMLFYLASIQSECRLLNIDFEDSNGVYGFTCRENISLRRRYTCANIHALSINHLLKLPLLYALSAFITWSSLYTFPASEVAVVNLFSGACRGL